MSLCGRVQSSYSKELSSYAIISTFFELSYVLRYVDNVHVDDENSELSIFGKEMLFLMSCLLEGTKKGVAMMLH